MKEKVSYTIRLLPREVLDDIKKGAKKNDRSINAEMIARLKKESK